MNSSIQIYDEVNISKQPRMMKHITASATNSDPENVYFSCKFSKAGMLNFKSERILVITNQSIFVFNGEQIRKKVMMQEIIALSISQSSDEFIFHSSEQDDLKLQSHDRRKLIIQYFLKIYCCFVKDNVPAFFFEDKCLEKYTNKKRGNNKLPMENYQFINEESWLRYLDKIKNANTRISLNLVYQRNKQMSSPQLNDFKILSLIGKGRISQIYLSERLDNGQKYCLKILDKKELKQQGDVDLESTQNIIKRHISHTFIEQLEYCFMSANKIYFVTKFYYNGDMFWHLKNQTRFSEERAKFYFIEIACLFGMLHEKAIIYKDLKPENVLIDEEGHIALTDFGICRTIRYSSDASFVVGTPMYLPPEVIRGNKYKRESDWWCLGMLLYEMLIGIPAFYHSNQDLVYLMILKANPYFPPNIEVSAECVDIILQLLQKNPNQRLGHSNDLDDLKGHKWLDKIRWEDYKNKKVESQWLKTPASNYLQHFDKEFTRQNTMGIYYD